MSWVFVGTDFFSPKSSNAKYKTQGTSEANFGGKKPRIILREVRYFFLFLNKNICFEPSLERLKETILMMGHNIRFKGEIYKIITKLSPLFLIWSTDFANKLNHLPLNMLSNLDQIAHFTIKSFCAIQYWARLFKTNDVVS